MMSPKCTLKLYSRCMDELLQFIKVYLKPHRMVSINNVCINFIAIWHINYIKKPFLLIIWNSYYIDISKSVTPFKNISDLLLVFSKQ